MNDEDILNFNYPLQPQELIDLEKEIKQDLRNISYNSKIPREIDRFSDKYIEVISEKELLDSIYVELLSPELMEMFGVKTNKKLDVVDVADGSSTEDPLGKIDEKDEKESLAGGDDYSDYFNEDEELVHEEQKGNKEDFI